MGSKPKIVQDIDEEEDGPPPRFQCIILHNHPKRLCSLTKLQPSMKLVMEKKVHRLGFSLSIHYHICHRTAIFHSIYSSMNKLQQLDSTAIKQYTDMETRGKQNDVEDDEDGPPPGWEFSTLSQALPSKQRSNTADMEMMGKQDGIQDDGDGPPPGWEFSTLSQALPTKPQSHTADMEMRGKQDGFEDDGDGPPPGWEFRTLSQALPAKLPSEPLADTADIKMESNELQEDEDDGPPPGWETIFPHQMLPLYKPPLLSSLAVSSGCEMGSKREIKNGDEGRPSGSQPESMPELLSPPTPPPKLLPSSSPPADIELGSREVDIKNGGERAACVPSPQPLQPMTLPSPPPVASSPSGHSTEKAQLVCGTCRKLLLYPRGAKWVQCPGCQEVNLVLEAHQIGQVNCGGCAVLLMYPHGAPAVQCSSCRFVTQIGAHNRRPPLSAQQAQRRRRRANRVR
ncbi:basic salivary proline-rich protein 1-like [Forsythia ovata]|uniref:Basic salivary proline-rich protein 1-like n=1 Tax=Forsythia ovata TaxID=205694 RepID=A0ABD1S2X0_9LAMI